MDTQSRNAIALKKLSAIVLPEKSNVSVTPAEGRGRAAAFQANIMRLGFIFDEAAFEAVASLPETTARRLHERVVSTLRSIKGDDVSYRPMYPNFPQQVVEASDVELFVNAILHYWTFGEWQPDYEVLPREFAFEDVKFRAITLATEEEFRQIVPTILSSADSISEEDKNIVLAIIDQEKGVEVPEEIPFAETRVWFGAALFDRGIYDLSFIQTTTDVLRFATALSGGDVSLSENTRFRNFRRPERRAMVRALERVIKIEDLARHRGKWIRLFHALHVGDYSDVLWGIAKTVRNNEHIETFNGRVEQLLADGKQLEAAKVLKTRPGEFSRRLLHLLSMKGTTGTRLQIIDAFADIVDQVPTRSLLQLRGMAVALSRDDIDLRVAFPKGSTQRAIAIRDRRERLKPAVASDLLSTIDTSMIVRLNEMDLPPLGNVWIDPVLDDCPLPTQQRSASESEWTVARGTQIPLEVGKDTLRFFIYWKGMDIDLSCTFHDDQFRQVGQVSYTALRNSGLETYHSGDITRAPRGASEFIDVNMAKAAKGARYVAMNVYVFTGPTFAEHEICYAGWMTRSKPNSNEIFDPKTVEQKVDVRTQSKNAIPVIFDLKERRAIWVDLATSSSYYYGGNNTESNRATTEEIVQSIVRAAETRTSLWDLFAFHGTVRGRLVNDREEADTTFGFERGTDITPYDVNAINADYVVG